VTFDIDANGILNVTAKDRATSNEQKITITSSSGLSKEEVDKMARDADSHSADDRQKKEEIDARNRADSMVYNVEKMLKDHRAKIGDADAKTIEAALAEAKDAMKQGGAERINSAREKLESASHRLAEAMYKSAAGAQAQGGPQGDAGAQQQQKPKENVVDAEFVDVDDKEKK
jgi:molecular chaperone DnaK